MKKALHILSAATALLISMHAGAVTQIVTVANFSFSPSSFTINLGDTVKWVWSNGSHTTTSTSVPTGAATWGSSMTSTSTTFTYVPVKAGSYSYLCMPHAATMIAGFTVNCGPGPARPVITSSNGNKACQGSAVIMSIPAQGGAAYQWFNVASTVSDTTVSLNATTSGSYTIKVSRCGIDSVSAPFIVTIDTLPKPAFTETHTGLAYTFTNTTNTIASHSYLWTFSDGSPAQTTVNASRTFAAPGTYTVTLMATNTATTCFATSSPFTVQATVGIGTLAGESYTILPNPATSVIDVNTSAGATLILTDFSGRAVAAPVTGSSKKQQINVSALPAGIYLLRIATANSSVAEKITVTH